MNSPTVEQIEAIVRAVLAAMAEPRNEPVFEGRLLGLKAAEGFDRGSRVVICAGTVVTPLARDLMKKNGVSVEVSATTIQGKGSWGFAIEHETGVTAALRRSLLEGPDGWSEIGRTAIDAARWAVSAPDRGAAVLTDEASIASWAANSVPGARAAVAIDSDSVGRSVRKLGANVLIVEARSQPIPFLRHMLATYRRGGPPRIPASLANPREVEPDEDRRDHRPSHPEPRPLGPAERALRDRLAVAAIGPRIGGIRAG